MAIPDLISSIRSREELVAVATASSMLTKAQVRLFAQCAGSTNPAVLEAAMLATQPRGCRGGPLVPYLVQGRLDEIGVYMDDVAKLLIAIYASDPSDLRAFFSKIGDVLAGRGSPISIGSQQFYAAEAPTTNNFLSAAHLHQKLATVGINTTLAWQGIREEDLGTGFSATTELKGNMPSTVHPSWQGAAALRSPAPDDGTAAAAAAAAGLTERVK